MAYAFEKAVLEDPAIPIFRLRLSISSDGSASSVGNISNSVVSTETDRLIFMLLLACRVLPQYSH